MGKAAGHDEKGEGPEHPAEFHIAPLGDENRERDGNGKIGEGDQSVGADMEPDQTRVPKQADAMRCKD